MNFQFQNRLLFSILMATIVLNVHARKTSVPIPYHDLLANQANRLGNSTEAVGQILSDNSEVQLACSVPVTESGDHLLQPFDATPPYLCRFNLQLTPGTCQTRLDFVKFKLDDPNALGDCDTEKFTIRGADNLDGFTICGENAGQHLYLQGSAFSIDITLKDKSKSSYDVVVTYIPCAEAFNLAPIGCSQYYKKPGDQVRSFNFKQVTIASNSKQYQINNQRYTICVDSDGPHQITWSPCNSNSFFISRDASAGSSVGSNNCVTDYLEIVGSSDGRYCGAALPSVTSSSKPFNIYVNFDGEEVYGLNLPKNPITGCQYGGDCLYKGIVIDPNNLAATPGAVLPCNSPNAEPWSQVCTLPPIFTERSDFANTGFCLRFALS